MANSVTTTSTSSQARPPSPPPHPPSPPPHPPSPPLATERRNKLTKSFFRFPRMPWRKKTTKKTWDLENDDIITPVIDFSVLQIATNNFSDDNMVGVGFLGSVYKGVLKNNQEIAVKRFFRREGFIHEVPLIGKFQHKNTLRMIGYCATNDENLLVYDYMANNTLQSFLDDNERSKILDWGLRFKIIEGIIKGLLYLHEDSQLNIIHRDIKPQNILLDSKMNPKISNYALSSSLFDVEHNQGEMAGPIAGTIGFLDPHYYQHGCISTKLDVYSLGITILVILTGKHAVSNLEGEDYGYLIDLVITHWEEGKIKNILDKNVVQSYSSEEEEKEILKTINIALLCINYDPELRPKISEILPMLKGYLTPSPDPLKFAKIREEHNNIKDLEDLAMEFVDLERATYNFSDENKLGEGGSGPVYKGLLIKGGQEIAVKRLRNLKTGLQQLRNEVLLVARLQHKYLVRILGYCINDANMLLVYEYMPNKSLDNFLFDPVYCNNLCWGLRLKIIQGIAEGLEFLHENSPQKIIHRDLKPANILLDAEMNPKISDFGISKIFHEDMTHLSTRHIYGTRGYMAPEYAMHGQFSAKSDIYSFGVMMLEIVSGKKVYGFYNSSTDSTDLPSYVLERWKNRRRIADVLDKNVVEAPTKEEEEKLSSIIDIALLCIEHDAKVRPDISLIVQCLTKDKDPIPTTLHATSFKGKGLLKVVSEDEDELVVNVLTH